MNIDRLNEQQLALLTKLIKENERVVVCAHKSPDGDAIGSILAWASFLSQQNKHVVCVVPDQAPDFLTWLPKFQTILRFDKQPEEVKQAFNQADLVCCLDFNETARVEELQPIIESCSAPRLLIDHHVSPNIPSTLAISCPDACSTCEIVFSLIWQLGGYNNLTHDMAVCLYCGMMTDTGGFTFASTRPQIFYIISLLLEKGINKDLIYNRVFHNYSLWALRFRSYILLNKLRVLETLHASYFLVSHNEMKRFHFVKGDLEGLVNIPLVMKGHKLSISLREDTYNHHRILISLRSSCDFHCREMAVRFFNGGGHEDAAGGHLDCTLEEAEQIALHAIMTYKEELS